MTLPRGFKVIVGNGVPVSLRAIVQPDGTILWSADGTTDQASGTAYVGLGDSPAAALANLGQTLAFHAENLDAADEVNASV